MYLQVPYTQNYTGSWVAGVKEGFGAMFWKDGDRFSSSLMSNEFYGLFRVNASEDKIFRYRGNWKGDLPEGKGEYQVKILCLIWNW